MNPLKEEQAWKKRQQRDLVVLALYISDFLIQAKESEGRLTITQSKRKDKDNSVQVLWEETQGLICSCTTAVTSVLALSHYRANLSSYCFVWTLPTTTGFHHWITRLVLREEKVSFLNSKKALKLMGQPTSECNLAVLLLNSPLTSGENRAEWRDTKSFSSWSKLHSTKLVSHDRIPKIQNTRHIQLDTWALEGVLTEYFSICIQAPCIFPNSKPSLLSSRAHSYFLKCILKEGFWQESEKDNLLFQRMTILQGPSFRTAVAATSQ